MPRFCQNPQCGKSIDDMYPSAKTCSAKCRWWAWTHRRKTVGLAHLVDDTLLSQVESLRQAIKRQDGRIAVLEKFMRG